MSSVFGNLGGLVLPSRRWTAAVRNAFGPIAAAADVLAIVAAHEAGCAVLSVRDALRRVAG